jgi:hypothetical protein
MDNTVYDLIESASRFEKPAIACTFTNNDVGGLRTAYQVMVKKANGHTKLLKKLFVKAVLEGFDLTEKSRSSVMNILGGSGYAEAVPNEDVYAKDIERWEDLVAKQAERYIATKSL